MFKRTIAAIMILAATLCLTFVAEAAREPGNGGGRPKEFHSPFESTSNGRDISSARQSGDQWLIYWYACGTDIESGRILFGPGTDLLTNKIVLAEPTRRTGDITRCIRELERADLSSGKVKILMQAGGTMVWGHEKFRSNNASIRLLDQKAAIHSWENGNWQFYKSYTENINVETPYQIGRYVFSDQERDWNPREKFSFSPNNAASKMGSKAGLEEFLRYGKEIEQELYPEGNVRRIFIFRDHGGGSLYGICWDEYSRGMLNAEGLRDANSVQLADIQSAFNAVWETSPETTLNNPPFEIVAFDACLMSTYETAVALEGIAHYMIASQASTYGRVSYDYDAFVSQLSQNPEMSSETLSRVICNTYRADALRTESEYAGVSGFVTDKLTVSVTDITKMPNLTQAYENFGNALLKSAGNFQNDFLTEANGIFLRTKNPTEKYGNYMVDLKELATELGVTFPNVRKASNELVRTLNKTVIYNLRGDGKGYYATRFPNGGGLSTYYPVLYDAEKRESRIDYTRVNNYAKLEGLAPESMKKLYADMSSHSGSETQPPQTGETNPPGDKVDSSVPKGNRYNLSDLSDVNVTVPPGTNTVSINLDVQQLRRISGVRCQMAWFNYYEDENLTEQLDILLLGGDTSLRENWKTGKFESTFSGKWLKIEGHPVFVQVVAEATKKDSRGNIISGYEIYAIPIMLNDRQCTLSVSCEYPSKTFRIIGAQPDSDSDIPVDEIYGLNKGDVVKPIYVRIKMSENIAEELEGATESEIMETVKDKGMISLVAGESFTIGDEVKVHTGTLPDGKYAYMFEFVNPVGGANEYTKPAIFTIQNGKVSLTENLEEMKPEKSNN